MTFGGCSCSIGSGIDVGSSASSSSAAFASSASVRGGRHRRSTLSECVFRAAVGSERRRTISRITTSTSSGGPGSPPAFIAAPRADASTIRFASDDARSRSPYTSACSSFATSSITSPVSSDAAT